MATNQLEIPVEVQNSDNYKQSVIEYNHCKNNKYITNVFLCYCSTTKGYFVSRIFSKQMIESYKTIKIIQ